MRIREFALAGLFLGVACGLALWLGSVQDAPREVILELRLPRVLLACSVGAALAMAGAALQALFANPLCEPYTLGISSGSALGAVLVAGTVFETTVSGLALPAFAGALCFSGILLVLSLRSDSSGLSLLLSGVMLGLVGSSLVAVRMALSDQNGLQSAIFWLMGDLSRARLSGALVSLGVTAVLGFGLFWRSRELDALMLGEDQAQALGLDVVRSRRWILFLSSLLVGLCVSGAGMIGFVGLVVPHFVRRRASSSLHGVQLPLAALWGAAVLVLADAVARKLAAPIEIPVGVVTALVGAPWFVWILLGRRKVGA